MRGSLYFALVYLTIMNTLELVLILILYFIEHWSFFQWFVYSGFLGILALYAYRGYWYAKGMATYVQFNNTPPSEKNRQTEPERCWDSVKTESGELWEAVREMSVREIILEASDVAHALVKWFIIRFFPERWHAKIWIWLIVFPFILPCTMKLGARYKKFGCIRNHKNSNNCGHTCDYLAPKKEV